MRLIKYIRCYGLKHTIEVIWKYKMDIMFQRVFLCFYRNKPLKNIIVLESHNDFDSNGGALYNYLISKGYNLKYKIVWLLKNEKIQDLPDNVECCRMFTPSLKKDYYLVNAKYKLTCQECTGSLRKGQISCYMTHGPVGLKSVKGIIHVPCELTYCLTPSNYLAPIIADQYNMKYPNDQQVILGYPMHDVFYTKGLGDLNKIVNCYYDKVILWMPTFRTNKDATRIDSEVEFSLGIPIIHNENELKRLNTILESSNALLIIKLHPMQDMSKIKISDLTNIIVLDGNQVKKFGVDVYKLMKDTDALISDYSSVAYDYLHLNKPIAYTMDDAKEYKLGFIVEKIEDLMAGDIIYNFDDLLCFVSSVIQGNDKYFNERARLFDNVFKYHDGNSSERLVNFLNM